MLEHGLVALAGHGIDGDGDQALDRVRLLAGQAAEAVTGQQVLPARVRFAELQPQHGVCSKGAANVARQSERSQRRIEYLAFVAVSAQHRLKAPRPFRCFNEQCQRLFVGGQPIGNQREFFLRPRLSHGRTLVIRLGFRAGFIELEHVWVLSVAPFFQEFVKRDVIVALFRRRRHFQHLKITRSHLRLDAARPHRLPEGHGCVVLRRHAFRRTIIQRGEVIHIAVFPQGLRDDGRVFGHGDERAAGHGLPCPRGSDRQKPSKPSRRNQDHQHKQCDQNAKEPFHDLLDFVSLTDRNFGPTRP